jgi:hypothetical protein
MPLCLLECWTTASDEEEAEWNDQGNCDAVSDQVTEELQTETAQNSPVSSEPIQTELTTAAAAAPSEVQCEVPADKPEQKQVYTPERLRAMLSFDDEDSDAFWEHTEETVAPPQTASKAGAKAAAKETLARKALASAATAAHKQQKQQQQQQQQQHQQQQLQQQRQQQQPAKRTAIEKFNAVLTQGPGLRVLKHHQSGRGAPQLRIIRYDAATQCIVWQSNKGPLHKRVSKSSSSSSSSSGEGKLASVPLSSVISVQRKHAVVTLWLKDSNGRGVGFEPQLEKDAIVLEEALQQLVGVARSSSNSPPPTATR